jgi:tRNA-dihydrouridine synthase A
VLTSVDGRLFGATGAVPTRRGVLEAYLPYVAQQLARGEKLSNMTRHILGLYHGAPGGRQFRRRLSERAHKPSAAIEVLREAIDIAEEWAQKIAAQTAVRGLQPAAQG